MFSTPLIASSKGVITLLVMVWASAPIYVVDTCTVGGAMSGYCSIGKATKPMIPSITMMTEITVDITGLSMNLSNLISLSLQKWN